MGTDLHPTEREVLVYSYYRDAELRGANLLFRMLRLVDDPKTQIQLTQHLADETRHAWLWTQRIQELGALPVPVTDGYQVRIGQRAGVPRDLVDLFALTVIVEQRALRRYREHMRRCRTPEATREVLQQVTRDEGWHIDWIRRQGRCLAAAKGQASRMERAVAKYRAIDREVMAELEAVENSLGQS